MHMTGYAAWAVTVAILVAVVVVTERAARASVKRVEESPPQHTECLEAKYMELIMAVGNKYPGETRHQTALRYIRQAEQSPAHDPSSITSGGRT